MTSRLLAALLAFVAAPLTAQTFGKDWFPHPANWTTAQATCVLNCPNLYPLTPGVTFGVAGTAKAQLLVPVADLPAVPSLLQDIAFLPLLNNGAFGVYHYDRLIVTLAQTPAATLSTTFAANLTVSPAVVLDVADHYWTPNGHSDPVRWPAAIGIDTPYFFDPALGNLVIDLEVHGGAQTVGTGFYGFLRSTTQTVAAFGWSGTPPVTGAAQTAGLTVIVMRDRANFEEMGRPCLTSQGQRPFLFDQTFGQPILGQSQRFDLEDGLPNGLAVLVGGLARLPFDLGALGASGCVLHTTPDATLAVVLDATGGTTQSLALPAASALVGVRAWFQFAFHDPAANALGVTTSSCVRLLLGSS